jgi:hypothetical protein
MRLALSVMLPRLHDAALAVLRYGDGEVHVHLALFGDVEAGDAQLVKAGLHAGPDAVEARGFKDDIHADVLGDFSGQVGVEADHVAVVVHGLERRKVRAGAGFAHGGFGQGGGAGQGQHNGYQQGEEFLHGWGPPKAQVFLECA